MSWIRTVLSSDTERKLLYSTSRSIIFMVGGIYTAWHFIATLTWPETFSPSLWLITTMMLVIVIASIKLLDKHYLGAHTIWLVGLTALVFQAYGIYQQPEILLLLVILPLMSIITVGYYGTALVVLLISLSLKFIPPLCAFPSISSGYVIGIIFGSVFTTLFGWGLSINLFTAIDSSSFHFQEARKLLDETRRHRAEISRMLKERNQANYQLERLNQMLYSARTRAEEARADRDRFILSVSHELRSPLNFIIGFSDLMVNSPETYAAVDEWPAGLYDDAQEIYRSSTHLLGLINDILDMGQIDAQQMTLFREKASLGQIAADVTQMVKTAFEQKGLTLIVEMDQDLPEVFVDSTRIRQVLLNLVNNSLRFTDRGSVTIGLERDNGTILVSVTDTGSGIAAEDIPKVFDEFRQVGVENWRRREGIGLGLSISRRFVQLHGGKMWLESSLGSGSCFYFTLPALESMRDLEAVSESGSLTTPKGYFSRQLRNRKQLVLILSTDPTAGEIVQQWLDDYSIIVVSDPRQVVSQTAKFLPQAILVDKMLMDAGQIPTQQLPYELPIIGIVLPSTRGRHHLLPAGVLDYLVKPVSRQNLIEAIQKLTLQNDRLLLVDDDPAMVRFVGQALKSAAAAATPSGKYELLTAYSGTEALEYLNNLSIGAVLLDLDLPDMSGWDVLEQLQHEADNSPPLVIIISAHDLPQTLSRNWQEVFELTMRRPLSQQELPHVLRALLAEIHPSYVSALKIEGRG